MTDQTYPPNDDQPAAPEEEGGEAVELTEEDLAQKQGAEETLRAEIADLNDRILRFAAELENTRRRAEREKSEAGRYAIASFARDLLAVTDTFERALAAAPEATDPVPPETFSAFLAGLKMTDKELLSVFERHGVRRINPKGEKFDPHLHQAVAQAPGDEPAGCVLDVAQPGFVIGDRVLRAAMVVVSTGPAAQSKSGEGGAEPQESGDESGETRPGSRIDTSA